MHAAHHSQHERTVCVREKVTTLPRRSRAGAVAHLSAARAASSGNGRPAAEISPAVLPSCVPCPLCKVHYGPGNAARAVEAGRAHLRAALLSEGLDEAHEAQPPLASSRPSRKRAARMQVSTPGPTCSTQRQRQAAPRLPLLPAASSQQRATRPALLPPHA